MKRGLSKLATFIVGLAHLCRVSFVHAFSADGPVVKTPLGQLRGVDYGDFLAFKGIPYAEPAGRFAPPVAKKPWPDNMTFDATHFGDACASSGSRHDYDPLESYGESEDCLYANVWVPQGGQSRLPVVVWIHGGGFMTRSGSFPGYWGESFVSDPDVPVVMVSFNYRLGIFGFYSSEDAGANFGFQDQQMLLQWVQTNIASFGGDPDRVTIMGQSAGAMSVVCHLAAPGSRGLFYRAVANSPVGLHYRSPHENAAFVKTVAKAVGCNFAANVTRCMRSRPWRVLKAADIAPEYLFHLEGPCKDCDNILPWSPVVDGRGGILPRSPVETFKLGEHAKVPTILSSVRNETIAFVPSMFMKLGNNRHVYELAMSALFKHRAPQIMKHYATSPDTAQMVDYAFLMGVSSTDALMTCYTRYVAGLLSQYAPTYLSTFLLAPHSSEMHSDALCVKGPPKGASCHAGDIAYVLTMSQRMTNRTGVGYMPGTGEAQLAHAYHRSLVDFAAGTSNASVFVPYDAKADVSVSWNATAAPQPERVVAYHKGHCDFLEALGFPDDGWGSRQLPAEQLLV